MSLNSVTDCVYVYMLVVVVWRNVTCPVFRLTSFWFETEKAAYLSVDTSACRTPGLLIHRSCFLVDSKLCKVKSSREAGWSQHVKALLVFLKIKNLNKRVLQVQINCSWTRVVPEMLPASPVWAARWSAGTDRPLERTQGHSQRCNVKYTLLILQLHVSLQFLFSSIWLFNLLKVHTLSQKETAKQK